MKILETFPQIAKAVACRFPYLIVDEAQDTSDIQMNIIDLLIGNGLGEVMLVGDPDQAIFEWNDARPDLLIQKFNEWGNSVILNENKRSQPRKILVVAVADQNNKTAWENKIIIR